MRMVSRAETCSGFKRSYEKCIFVRYIESRNTHGVKNIKTKDGIKNFKPQNS